MRWLIFVFALLSTGASAQGRRFQFAHISDTHIGGAVTASDDLRATVRDINANDALKFVIITGDITEFGADTELREAKSLFDSLNKPWYIIPGNHDANWSESGANSFRTVFGSETSVFQYGGFLFAGTACGPNMRMGPGQVPHENIVWLDSVLRHLPKPDMPVIYMNHYPQDSSQNNWYEAMALLKRHNVQLILCGHGHSNHLLNFEGVPGIMGRSNLRARDSIGGYNIVTITGDSVFYRTKRPGLAVEPVWASARLYDHHFSSDTTHYYRPSFAVNSRYPFVTKRWAYQAKSDIGTGNVLLGNLVIGTDTDGWIFALDRKTGKKLWGYRTDGKVYFGCWGNDLYALDKVTGRLVWKWNNGATNRMYSPAACWPVATGGRLFIVAPDQVMTAIDAATGVVLWRSRAPKLRVRESMGLSADSSLVYVKTMDGAVIGVSTTASSLQIDWRSSVELGYELAPTALMEQDGVVLVPTHSGTVWALARKDGELLWKYKASNCMVNGVLPVGGGDYVISTMDGKLTCVAVKAGSAGRR